MTEKTPYLIDDLGRLVLESSPSSVVNFSGQTWINNIAAVGSRREVTLSIYDEMPQMQVTQGTGTLPATDLFSHYSKNNTRNRIVATLYQEVYNSDFNNHYDALSLYDYDVHGNVKELIQVNNDLDLVSLGQHVKKMLYEYDLVSGNVKQVTYQEGRMNSSTSTSTTPTTALRTWKLRTTDSTLKRMRSISTMHTVRWQGQRSGTRRCRHRILPTPFKAGSRQ